MTTPQQPLPSGLGVHTSADQAMGGRSLEGMTAIVTGGYAGIGLETTRALARAGATVVVPARDPEKARKTLAAIPGKVEQATLDLMDPASVDAFAESFLASGRPLHILVNNAGISAYPETRDSRGYEAQFATNHLGHFQLTARLWPALVQAQGARVVALTSAGHRFSGVHVDDPNFNNRPYNKWESYGQSKSANILFALRLDAQGKDHKVRAFSVHPGKIMTELGRHIPREEQIAMKMIDEKGALVGDYKTAEEGASTSLWCAVNSQLDGMGGVYCEDCDISPAVAADCTTVEGVRPWAIDPKAADDVWRLSERMTGVPFPI